MLRRSLAVLTLIALLAMGGQAAARKRATRPHAVPAGGTYKVVKGDNLSKIAARFGTSVGELARANGINNPNQVRIDAVLRIPTAPAAAGSAPRAGSGRLPLKLRQSPERLALVPLFDRAASRHKVPADLLKAVAWQESGWQNDKVSSVKALGIGQLMPATVDFVNDILLRKKLDPHKPADNITISARYLAWLLHQTKGDVPQALAGYYQGLASVRRQGPLPQTEVYIKNVLALRGRF